MVICSDAFHIVASLVIRFETLNLFPLGLNGSGQAH